MNLTIYVSEELGRRVKAAKGLEVSRVCQVALERELAVLEQVGARLAKRKRRDGAVLVPGFVEMETEPDSYTSWEKAIPSERLRALRGRRPRPSKKGGGKK